MASGRGEWRHYGLNMQMRVVVGVGLACAGVVAAAAFAFYGNRELYYTVDELADRGWLTAGVSGEQARVDEGSVEAAAPLASRWRIRGRIDRASVSRADAGDGLRFDLVGASARLAIRFEGVLPDSFEQAITVTVGGRMGADGVFLADDIAAQCPTKYAPARPDSEPSTMDAAPQSER